VGAELETAAAVVDTWPPADAPPRAWGWGTTTTPSVSTPGLLVLLCGIFVLVYFVRGLSRRKDIWEPLWFGLLALAMGLMGTVSGVIGLPGSLIGGYLYDRDPSMLLLAGSILEALSIPLIILFVREPKSSTVDVSDIS